MYRYWRQAHRSVIPEDHCESMLRHVQPALDDIAWEVHREEFEGLLVTKTLTACHTAHSDALAVLERASSARHTSTFLHMRNLSEGFAASKDVFIT